MTLYQTVYHILGKMLYQTESLTGFSSLSLEPLVLGEGYERTRSSKIPLRGPWQQKALCKKTCVAEL